jgi:hypothetical protein
MVFFSSFCENIGFVRANIATDPAPDAPRGIHEDTPFAPNLSSAHGADFQATCLHGAIGIAPGQINRHESVSRDDRK